MTEPDYRAQAERLLREHRPKGIEGMNVLDYADLAAELDWPVESSAAFAAEQFGIDDESARELMLGARTEKLDRDLKHERNS